jgi:hypothetical protein
VGAHLPRGLIGPPAGGRSARSPSANHRPDIDHPAGAVSRSKSPREMRAALVAQIIGAMVSKARAVFTGGLADETGLRRLNPVLASSGNRFRGLAPGPRAVNHDAWKFKRVVRRKPKQPPQPIIAAISTTFPPRIGPRAAPGAPGAVAALSEPRGRKSPPAAICGPPGAGSRRLR